MKPLVLASSTTEAFTKDGFADVVLDFAFFRFVWGPPPSSDELAHFLGPFTTNHDNGRHWSAWGGPWETYKNWERPDLSLADFCQQFEAIELWFDLRPEAQMKQVWLLDYFRAYPKIIAKLKLRLVPLELIMWSGFSSWDPPLFNVTEKDAATASAVWQAYRSSTPEACLDVLQRDLSVLPLLRPALLDMLEELPSASTGLGASEMRMLELISWGYANVNPLFHHRDLRQTRVFSEWEYGYLLDGLAFGPHPAISGHVEELRTIPRDNIGARHQAMLRSRFTMTDFGKDILAHKEDFSRHNPIDRWWGGTHLTNDNLWRWSPALTRWPCRA